MVICLFVRLMYLFISLISLTFELFSGNLDKLAELLPINLTRNSEKSKEPDKWLKVTTKDMTRDHNTFLFHHTYLSDC